MVWATFANRSVVATLLGFGAFTLVLHGAWLTTIVFAFRQGGAAETGAVAFATTLPAAIMSPVVAVWFDRFEPRMSLMLSLGLQALALFFVAAAVWTGSSEYLAYVLIGALTIVQMSSRPTVSAVLPRIVSDPTELATAYSATGLVETVGLVAGPALAGVLLAVAGDAAVAFLVFGITMALGASTALVVDRDPLAAESRSPNGTVWGQVADGARLLRSEAAPRQIVMIMAAMRLVVGVLEVGIVIIAVDHLGRSEASAGILATAIGVGAVLGSALTFLLVGRRRLSLPLALGVAAASLPVAAISLSENFWVIVGLLAFAGLGRPIVDVAGRTLLQGLSSDDVLARIFGFLEGLSYLMLAIGSAVFSALTVAVGIKASLVITGFVPPVLLAVLYAQLRQVDANRPEVAPELVALIRSTPLFAPLAAFRIEQMAQNMHRQVWTPRQTLFSAGDYGEVLYLVHDGWVHIDLDDPLGIRRGGLFGEIAVLRSQPRMATVAAGSEGAVTYRIHRDVFLDALATAPTALRRGTELVRDRLGEEPS